ncbi:MAG: NAD+ synthase [archaeon]|nr:NAD+ synthase [archaeon]
MKIAIAQIDTTAGALFENGSKIIDYINKAKESGCDLVVFPEMALTGYPICDLVYEKDFLESNKRELERIAKATTGIATIVGFIDFDQHAFGDDGTLKKFNSAALLKGGKIIGRQSKTLLPTYDVFDEKRFFTAASQWNVFELYGKKIGITLCEDMWDEHYSIKPVDNLIEKGAELIINISASPFHVGKFSERRAVIERHASKGVDFVFANKVGVQDNGLDILVFDGQSMAVNNKSEFIAIGPMFLEQLIIFDVEGNKVSYAKADPANETFDSLVFALKGYAKKCNFQKAVLGLSGGIDSSVVVCIAAKALGSENVLGVTMPSRFSSKGSVEDSKEIAKNLGIEFKEWPIETVVKENSKNYLKVFGEQLKGTAAENPQARLRGNTLMTISNSQNRLLLSTGNKTEIALGYCTLYGDMAGGIEVIGDLSKIRVYSLAEHINKVMGNPIPKSVIDKPPSAELAPGQEDPFDYEKVSPLVDLIVEANKTREELIKTGFSRDLVEKMKKLVDSTQYKRKQAPPIIRISKKAFGSGRVYPIINKWE